MRFKYYDLEYSYSIFKKLARDTEPSLLDIGIGNGSKASSFASLASEIIGIDISPDMLKEAHSKGLKVIRGDARVLPFKNETLKQ